MNEFRGIPRGKKRPEIILRPAAQTVVGSARKIGLTMAELREVYQELQVIDFKTRVVLDSDK